MGWNFEMINRISEELLPELISIYESNTFRFFHQDPQWLQNNPENLPVLVARDKEKKIVAYAGLQIKPLKTIHISFGPVVKKPTDMANVIVAMARWLQKHHWWRLTMQLPFPEGEGTAVILNDVLKLFPFRQSDKFFNWKSWWLTIDREPLTLLKSFSSQHQKSIQHSNKKGISYEIIRDVDKAASFAELHNAMYKYRNLPNNEKENYHLITTLHSFLQKSGKGFLLGAELEGQLVGGVVIVFQGNSAYYYLGASTTQQRRNIPILYGAFYEIISYCWKSGIHTLDFGGFAVGEKEGSQLYNINRFKMGFGGNIVDYPAQMVFDLNPLLSHSIEKGIQFRNKLRKWRQKK